MTRKPSPISRATHPQFGRQGRNAWDKAIKCHSAGKPPAWMVGDGDTEFEKMARAAGVPKGADIVALARVRAVSAWVRKYHERYWVPEPLLEELGIIFSQHQV